MANLTAQSGAVVSAAGSSLSGNLQQQLATLRVKYNRNHGEVAGETEKLAQTNPPSRFAFCAILLTGITFDALNYVTIWLNVAPGVGVLIDVITSVIFLFCVRALMNRPVSTQRILGLTIVVALLFTVFLGPMGGVFIGYALLLPIFYMGIRNPGVRVTVVDKEKIQQSIQQFEKTVQEAQAVVSRLANLGRKTKGLQKIAVRAAGSKPVKAFSGSSKIMRRLLGTRVAEMVPFLSLLPFNVISTFMTYSALKKDDIEAKELLAEYQERRSNAQSIETDTLREQYQAHMAGVITELIGQEAIPVPDTAATSRITDVRKPNPQPVGRVAKASQPSAQHGTMTDVRSTPARVAA